MPEVREEATRATGYRCSVALTAYRGYRMLLSPCRDMGWMMFDVFSCHGCCSRRSKNASIAPTRMLKASAARVKRANALMGAWSLPRLALDGNQAHRPV